MQTEGAIAEARLRLGRRIAYLRRKQGLSQVRFALMIGINRTYLIDVEYGRRNVAFDNLYRIAKGLRIPLSVLVEDIEKVDEGQPD